MELTIKTFENKDVGSMSVSDLIFGLDPREDILHRVVRWQLARRQAGTHATTNRSEVSRTGAKMYKQKGTGRARHSSAKVSQFRGGAKSHGPVARSHAFSLPKKIRTLGLKHALSSKIKNNDLLIIDSFDITDSKTGEFSKKLSGMNLSNALFIGDETIKGNFSKVVSNLPNIDVLLVAGLNVYDILRRDKVVLSKKAVEMIEERFK